MLNRKKIFAQCAFIIIFTVVLSACGTRATPEPTIDVNQIATNAVQTIEARATETALAKPTDTPQPTYTPVSFTPTTASLPISLPTASSGNSISSSVATLAVPAGGVTSAALLVAQPTATLASVGDKAVWADQSIADGTHYSPGESDDLIWYITNIGTTTWTTSYSLRFFTGTNFAKAGNTRYYLTQTTAPQQTASITIDFVAPTTPGEYKMSWVLSNENDSNFYIVDFTIVVD